MGALFLEPVFSIVLRLRGMMRGNSAVIPEGGSGV